jgi:dTDP-4-dehydrorhamnose 3,5-epimerase/CDP-3, 6-dideoxy-D-glycero-D-glycero-4-hexulose-5-epimerase
MGAVLDVIVDIRGGSETYGESAQVELSANNQFQFWIPKGFAHGFLALEDNTMLIYKTDHVYAPDSDTGIRWDSFGFDWPISNPVFSDRDASFPELKEFQTTFLS